MAEVIKMPRLAFHELGCTALRMTSQRLVRSVFIEACITVAVLGADLSLRLSLARDRCCYYRWRPRTQQLS